MSHYGYRFIALVLAAALSLMACSDDGGANNGTATNNGQADVTEDAQQQLDAASDVADEDSQADTAEGDTAQGAPHWLPDFRYRNITEGTGVSVNVNVGRVGKIGRANERTESMTDQEIADLNANILTEATRDKMINGWDCGDAIGGGGADAGDAGDTGGADAGDSDAGSTGDTGLADAGDTGDTGDAGSTADAAPSDLAQWTFEGRVLVNVEERKYEEIIIDNIAGCVGADSTAPDAARVQEIIQHLDDLRDDHFQ
jgi:hypothetical protein